MAMDPPRFLAPGDVVRCEVEGARRDRAPDRLAGSRDAADHRRCAGRHRPLRRHRRAVLRARHHRGPAAGPRAALLHDRDAHRRGARAARRRALRPLLRAAAQGRGLLGQRRAHGGAVRRRRPGGQAHVEARRLVAARARAFVWSVRTVAPGGSLRERAAPPEGASATRATSRASSWRRAATAAPRSRACSTSPRRPPRRSARLDEHWDGRGDAGRPARGGDPAARAHPLPRPDRRDLPRGGRRAGRPRGGAAPARALVRPGARGRVRSRSAATAAFWAALERARRLAAGSRAELLLRADDERLDRIAEAFARVIDAKSPFTARHSERVAEIAVGIGGVLGFDAATQRDLRRAGLLHDIGKLAISNRILDKPGKLTDEEFATIKEHPAYSLRDPRARAVLRPDRRARGQPPRADRRHAATRAGSRRGARPADARARRRRRLRGADRRPALPRAAAASRRRSTIVSPRGPGPAGRGAFAALESFARARADPLAAGVLAIAPDAPQLERTRRGSEMRPRGR